MLLLQLSLVVEKQGRGGLREVSADVQKRDPTKNALVDKESELFDKFKSGGAIGGQSTKSTGARQVRQLVLATEEGSIAVETPEERLKMLKRTKGNDLAGAMLHPYSIQMYSSDSALNRRNDVDDEIDLSLEIESDEDKTVTRYGEKSQLSTVEVAYRCLEVRDIQDDTETSIENESTHETIEKCSATTRKLRRASRLDIILQLYLRNECNCVDCRERFLL